MPAIPLLHSFPGNPVDGKGLQALGNSIPVGWEPESNTYDPAAFPTPFGRAEATALILKAGAPGVELFEHFRLLLLGVLAGVLRVVPEDLARLDNLGRALMLVDGDARYFCKVVEPATSLTFGASYRSCLLWSHARRDASDWNRLRTAIDPRLGFALALLAQWRDTLRSSGRWSGQVVAWQRAVDVILEQAGTIALDPASLDADSRQTGPFLAQLPFGDSARPARAELLYLPAHDPGRLRRFRALLQATPSTTQDSVTLVDTASAVRARIVILPAVATGANKLAAGVGAVELFDGTAAPGTGAPRVEEIERLLEPVCRALIEENRPVDTDSVRGALWAYPDAIRLLALTRGTVPATILLSSAAQVACFAGAALPPESSEDVGFLQVGAQRLVLLDKLGDVSLLELRALGLTLFRVFTGELTTRAGVLTRGTAAPLLHVAGPPFASDSRNPLEPSAASIQAVNGEPPQELRKKLATLQRFVATYAGAELLLGKASRSFAAWAADRDEPVAPLGKVGERSLPLQVTGFTIPLAADAPAPV